MKSKALIFDLDDTLIDTKIRHFQVLKDYLLMHDLPILLSFDNYCNERKKMNWTNLDLLSYHYNKIKEDEFKMFWESNIEDSVYLLLDKIIVNLSLIEKVCTHFDLYLISLRSNSNSANFQISKFPFYPLFRNISFLSHTNGYNPKIKRLLELKEQYSEITLIGDSWIDKQAANEANVDFVLVQTGIHYVNHHQSFLNINIYLDHILNNY